MPIPSSRPVLLLFLVLISPPPTKALSEENGPPARGRWKIQLDASGRYAPSGGKLRVGVTWRGHYGKPAPATPSQSYLQAGLAAGVSPASVTSSMHAEWLHLAFLILRTQADLYRYLGAYGALLEFPDRTSPFGAAAQTAASGRELARFGGRVLLQPTLRAKLGRVFLRNQTEVAWYAFGAGGPYFLEKEYDTLLKNGDGLVVNRTTVLLQLWARDTESRLLVGPSYEIQRTSPAVCNGSALEESCSSVPWNAWAASPALVFSFRSESISRTPIAGANSTWVEVSVWTFRSRAWRGFIAGLRRFSSLFTGVRGEDPFGPRSQGRAGYTHLMPCLANRTTLGPLLAPCAALLLGLMHGTHDFLEGDPPLAAFLPAASMTVEAALLSWGEGVLRRRGWSSWRLFLAAILTSLACGASPSPLIAGTPRPTFSLASGFR